MAASSNETQAERESKRRYGLAVRVVLASFVLMVAVSVAVIWASDGSKESTQLVFSALLPILGTWVGTVLAFYFARENLKAATDSAVALTRPVKKPTDVSGVMIGPAEITAADVKDNAEALRLTVGNLKQKMDSASPPRTRLPIRDAKGVVLYIVHESALNKFLTSEPPKGDSTTLDELLKLPGYESLKALAFVSSTATLAEAREAMARMAGCNDVFVTTGGQATEPIVGWLTNTLLAEHD